MNFKEWWNKSSVWKQGFFIGLSIFSLVLIYGLVQIKMTDSDMKWIGIMIPILPIVFLFDWYARLNIPDWLSVLINLVFYYILGIIIAYGIKQLGVRK